MRRVSLLSRPPTLLEKTLTFLNNLPLEFFTHSFEMPWFNLFNDIKQWVFYTNLLVLRLIFAGGHLIGESEGLIGHWRNLA